MCASKDAGASATAFCRVFFGEPHFSLVQINRAQEAIRLPGVRMNFQVTLQATLGFREISFLNQSRNSCEIEGLGGQSRRSVGHRQHEQARGTPEVPSSRAHSHKDKP